MQPTAPRRRTAGPAILTWRAHDVPRMESVRVQLSGNRIKAYGRIVAAATASHPAFSASYDLVTDESGATKRLSLTVTLAERERQLSIARDEESMWLVQDHRADHPVRLRRRAGRRRGLQPVLQRAADPPHRGAPQRWRVGHPAGGLRAGARPVGRRRDHQLQHGLPTASSCTRRSPTPRSPSTTTGSSSTTQAWQRGSDHPARAPGRGEFVAPALRADDGGDDLRPAEAVVADACGVAGLDEFGDRPVVGQLVAGVGRAGAAPGRARAAAARSSPRTSPAPGPVRSPRPGCRRGTTRPPARTPAGPRRRWRRAPRRAGAAGGRSPRRRRRARRSGPGRRRHRSPAPGASPGPHVGSTWSSTLTTHGAPTNRSRVAGRPPRMRGAGHRVPADEPVQQTGVGDFGRAPRP